MAKTWSMHHIILVISSRRGIISITIGEKGSGGTNEVTILIFLIVIFRISTKVVVAAGIIINVIFGIVIIVDGNIMAEAEAPLVIIIFCVVFGCSIKVRLIFGRGWGTIIIRSRKKMKMVAFEIVIDVVFGIVIAVVVVVNCESPILNPGVKKIIIGVID